MNRKWRQADIHPYVESTTGLISRPELHPGDNTKGPTRAEENVCWSRAVDVLDDKRERPRPRPAMCASPVTIAESAGTSLVRPANSRAHTTQRQTTIPLQRLRTCGSCESRTA